MEKTPHELMYESSPHYFWQLFRQQYGTLLGTIYDSDYGATEAIRQAAKINTDIIQDNLIGYFAAAPQEEMQATCANVESMMADVLENIHEVLDKIQNVVQEALDSDKALKPKKSPQKLIRANIVQHLKDDEYKDIDDIEELNYLYDMKVKEELQEIINSNQTDINEFADLYEVVLAYARINGHSPLKVISAAQIKLEKKGGYDRLVLTNLNPHNPSNKIYFKD